MGKLWFRTTAEIARIEADEEGKEMRFKVRLLSQFGD